MCVRENKLGKKRAVSIRRIAEILTKHNPKGFTTDFDENKRLICEMMYIPSKKMRNKIAGYITAIAETDL